MSELSVQKHIPEHCLKYVKMSGADLADRIGADELKKIVGGVLCGENIRTATEPLTRYRISILNAALLQTLRATSQSVPASDLHEVCRREYFELASTDPRKTVLQWILGLTGKQIQNVLRSDDKAWGEYLDAAWEALGDSVSLSRELYGDMTVRMENKEFQSVWDWTWVHTLMIAIGSQTLATRGAEKSMYGKFFEKLILGSVLDLLGFTFDTNRSGKNMTFWLSHRGERRESDATAIVSGDKGIRFDIGFIGTGNTEISLDKVSRFDKLDTVAGKQRYMSTIIIVDRIGKNSRIVDMARDIDGNILQMSSSLWAKSLDSHLFDVFPTEYARTFSESSTAKDIRELVNIRIEDTDLHKLVATAADS